MNLKGSQVHFFQKEGELLISFLIFFTCLHVYTRFSGIPIRHNRSAYLMHHKFVIIDSSSVITGSFNWTQAAVIGTIFSL